MARSTRHPTRQRRVRKPVAPESPELAALLERYARQLDAASDWGCSPILWGIGPWSPTDDEEPHRFVVDLDGESVPSRLLGFRAPADWHALGCWTTGNAFHTDDTGKRKLGVAGRIRTTYVVHRSGMSLSLLQRDDEAEPTLMGSSPIGRISDYTRRALGMPTDPPEHSTIELLAIDWLATLIDQVPRTWADAVVLHRAVGSATSDDLAALDLAPVDALMPLSMAMAIEAPWEHLRKECGKGRLHVPTVTRELAWWCDEGTFSREVLSQWPPLEALIEAAIDVLPIDVVVELMGVLETWGLWGGRA